MSADRYRLGSVPAPLRRRANLLATVAMAGIAGALLIVIVLIEGVRPEPLTWAVLAGIGPA